ncbi:hypothetical protein Uis1B_1504 [Bifidobacterium margollesii]|uniref:Sugar-binding protein n=1 Tax=Bifidobacterium margollesii TaxID=2020964 RepID=A0A2N5J8Z3_9BIFI|nr:hypothetical protein [Bifidobacterium margollesii]PLS30677.1 hypothetical protein Uis1B_1504 [Bifidobacterium margollesii]
MVDKQDDSPNEDRRKMDLWFPIDDEPQTSGTNGNASNADANNDSGDAEGNAFAGITPSGDSEQTAGETPDSTNSADTPATGTGNTAAPQTAIKPLAEGDVVNTQWDIPPITFPALVEKTGPKHTADGAGSAQPSAPAQTFGPVIPAADVTNSGNASTNISDDVDASAMAGDEPDEESGRTIVSATPHDGGDDLVDTAVITPLNAGFTPKNPTVAAADQPADNTTTGSTEDTPANLTVDTNADPNDTGDDHPESGVEQLAETVAESPEEVFGDAVHQPINSAATISMPAVGAATTVTPTTDAPTIAFPAATAEPGTAAESDTENTDEPANPEATMAFNPLVDPDDNGGDSNGDNDDAAETVAFTPEDVKAAQAENPTGTAADQKASIFPDNMDPTANTFQLAGLPLQPDNAADRERARNLSAIESLEPKPGEKDPLALVPPDQQKKQPNRKPIIIAAVAAVAVIALAVAGVMVVRNRNANSGTTDNQSQQEHQTALTACLAAVDDYNSAKKSLDSAVSGVRSQLGITADQVTDANTVSNLKKAVDAAGKIEDAKSCDTGLSANELKSNTKDTQKLTSTMKSQALAVTAAAKSVTSSRDAKNKTTTDNAKQNLQTAVDNAQALFESSRYNVADDQTRVQLQIALGTANTLLDQDNPDLTEVQNAISALSTASANVEASMQQLQNNTAANSTQSNDGTQGGTTTNGGNAYTNNSNTNNSNTTNNNANSNTTTNNNGGGNTNGGGNGNTNNNGGGNTNTNGGGNGNTNNNGGGNTNTNGGGNGNGGGNTDNGSNNSGTTGDDGPAIK